MKTRILPLIAAALILTASAIAQDTANRSESKTSNTSQASCIVKISCDPDVLPLSFQTIEYLLHSSSVGGKAVQQILNQPPEKAPELIIVESLPLDDKDISRTRTRKKNAEDVDRDFYRKRAMRESRALGIETPRTRPPTRTFGVARSAHGGPLQNQLLLHLEVAFGKAVKPAAIECMNAVIENLRRALKNAFETTVNTIQNELNLARFDYDDAEEELAKAVGISPTKDDNLPKSDRSLAQMLDESASIEDLIKRRNDLLANKQKIEMDLKIIEVRADAMQKQMGEIRVKIDDKLTNDPTIRELQEMVHILSERSKADKTDRGLGNLEALLNARMKFAEQREKVAQSAGADRVQKLTDELSDMRIDIGSKQVEREMTEKQLAEVEKQLKAASALQPKLSRIRIARRRLDSAERRLIDSKARMDQLQLMRPTVTVIGAQ